MNGLKDGRSATN